MFGASSEQLAALRQCNSCCMVEVKMERPQYLGWLWATAVAQALADKLGTVIVCDEFSGSLRPTPPLTDGRISVGHQIFLPFSVDETGKGCMTTVGLQRFGLPELEFAGVPPSLGRDWSHVANALAGALVDRARFCPPAEAIFALNEEICFTEHDLAAGLKGFEPLAPVAAHQMPSDEPSQRSTQVGFSLVDGFLRVGPPRDFREGCESWYFKALADLTGAPQTATAIDPQLLAHAHQRALAELPGIRERFAAGLRTGQVLLIKRGFPVPRSGGQKEFLWVSVRSWSKGRISGHLINDPRWIDKRAGQRISFSDQEVYDWMIQGPGRSLEGGYTNTIVTEWHSPEVEG